VAAARTEVRRAIAARGPGRPAPPRVTALQSAFAVAAAWLAAAALLAGCARPPSIVHVTPLPPVTALQGQSAADQDWDIKDCQAEAGYRTGYSPTDSPLANVMQRLFFFGTAGASLGGLITGFPVTVESQATEGLIAGAGAGGIAGGVVSLGQEDAFQTAWAACMRAKAYAVGVGTPVVPPGAKP